MCFAEVGVAATSAWTSSQEETYREAGCMCMGQGEGGGEAMEGDGESRIDPEQGSLIGRLVFAVKGVCNHEPSSSVCFLVVTISGEELAALLT